MIRHLFAALALLSVAAHAEDAPPAEGPKPKLALVPFATLSADIPSRSAVKALAMLTQEFRSADTHTLVELRHANPQEAFADPLAKALRMYDEAKELRNRKKFRLADEGLSKAVAEYRAAAPGITDVSELVDALALLAAVQFNTGRDEEGAKNLGAALALAPERELPLAATSPLFARVVADARKALKAQAKAQLVIESVPSNAPVALDGVSAGATPVAIADVPPGQHLWHAVLPNGEIVGGLVDVAAGKQTKLQATAENKTPEAKLLSSLAQNRIDDAAIAAAKDTAKAVDAEFVVFGALSRDGKDLRLHAFLYSTTSSELRRLPETKFDGELLAAGMEFYNLVGEVKSKGLQVGEALKPPGILSSAPSMGGPLKVAEAKYGVVPGKDDVEGDPSLPATPAKAEPKKPLGPRAPLKKKTP